MPGIVCQGDRRLTWAKYAVVYTEVAGTTKSFSPYYSRTKKAASAYTIQNGVFVLKSPSTKEAEDIAVGDYLVNVSTSNNTATSGSTICKVTGNTGRKWNESWENITSNYASQDSFYGYRECTLQDDGTFLLSGVKTWYDLSNNNFRLYSNNSAFTGTGVSAGPHTKVYTASLINGALTVQEVTSSLSLYVDITYTPITLSGAKGAYVGEVKANEGTYPENGIKDGFWYVLLN